jgi:uncharacterized protein DUF6328
MAEQQDRDAVPGDGRDETENQRLDRNWNALLQELRILQTGTQLLTGFLLTVAFQQTFSALAFWQKVLYLAVVSLAVASTACTLMPVALHRALFRRGAMDELVQWGGRMLRLGLMTTGLAVAGSLALIFSRVTGVAGALAAGAAALLVLAALWLALPLSLRRRVGPPHPTDRPAR